MRNPLPALAFLMAGALGLSGAAQAGIVFDSGLRVVSANATSPEVPDETVSMTAGVFNEGAAIANLGGIEMANQTSDVQPLMLTGNGMAHINTNPDNSTLTGAVSIFDVSFTLLTPHDFMLDAAVNGFVEVGSFNVLFLLERIGDSQIALLNAPGSISGLAGTLTPGSYALTALAGVGPNASGLGLASADFGFELFLTEVTNGNGSVPGPDTLMLFALGTLLLAAVRRRLG